MGARMSMERDIEETYLAFSVSSVDFTVTHSITFARGHGDGEI